MLERSTKSLDKSITVLSDGPSIFENWPDSAAIWPWSVGPALTTPAAATPSIPRPAPALSMFLFDMLNVSFEWVNALINCLGVIPLAVHSSASSVKKVWGSMY